MSRADVVARWRSNHSHPQELETDDDANLYVTIAAGLAGLALDATVLAANALLTTIDATLSNISGSVSTRARQDTGNASLASIDTKAPALGSAAMADAVPVTLATDDTVGATLAKDATLTGGAQVAILKSGLKGASAAAVVTSTANGDDHQALDAAEQFAPAAEDNTNGVFATQNKPIAANTYAPSLNTGYGAVTKVNVKASAGNVLGVTAVNRNGALRYFQLHNKATAPAAAEVPLYSFAVPAGEKIEIAEFFAGSGGYFSTGIGWAWSTTAGTFTDSATANEHENHIHYK